MAFLKALLLLVAVAHSSLGAPAEANLFKSCADYVLVSSRGTFEPQGPSVGFRGAISTTLRTVSKGKEYDTIYPAAPTLNRESENIGSKNIQNYITKGLKSCPQQKYVLLGYSQGATVTLLALRALLSPEAQEAIRAIVLIGNPYQVKNQAFTVDENGGSSTRANDGVLLPLEPSLGNLDLWTKSDKVINVCYTDDIVCNGAGNKNGFKTHLLYGSSKEVQNRLSEFIVSKVGAA